MKCTDQVLRSGVFSVLMIAAGCGGSGGNSIPAGSGTIRDPYVVQAGQTYSVPVMGERETCGKSFDPRCSTFDSDYVTVKFTVPETGNYKASFTGVDSGHDLVILTFEAQSSTSTSLSYVGTLDDNGKGIGETYSGPLTGGRAYWLFLQMWGGPDTIEAHVDKAN